MGKPRKGKLRGAGASEAEAAAVSKPTALTAKARLHQEEPDLRKLRDYYKMCGTGDWWFIQVRRTAEIS